MTVRLPNSSYVQRVTIPEHERDIALQIPDGLLPVVVINAVTGRPVSGAEIVWTTSGARSEARSVASGDALLEGVESAPGTLVVTASGYERAQVKLAEPPPSVHEVALTPSLPRALQVRVGTSSGEPLTAALVEVTPEQPTDAEQVAVADVKGVVRFDSVPTGALRVTARAKGYAAASTLLQRDSREELTFLLSPGDRASINVELPNESGPLLVRVLDQARSSVDDFLDLSSDRSIHPPGRLSLGPLAPGVYLVELLGAERRQLRLQIVDRDVSAVIK